MFEIQQFTKLIKHPKPTNVLQRDIYTYFISYNIIIWAVVGEMYNS